MSNNWIRVITLIDTWIRHMLFKATTRYIWIYLIVTPNGTYTITLKSEMWLMYKLTDSRLKLWKVIVILWTMCILVANRVLMILSLEGSGWFFKIFFVFYLNFNFVKVKLVFLILNKKYWLYTVTALDELLLSIVQYKVST